METTEVNEFAENRVLMQTGSEPNQGLGYSDTPLGRTENKMAVLPFS